MCKLGSSGCDWEAPSQNPAIPSNNQPNNSQNLGETQPKKNALVEPGWNMVQMNLDDQVSSTWGKTHRKMTWDGPDRYGVAH